MPRGCSCTATARSACRRRDVGLRVHCRRQTVPQIGGRSSVNMAMALERRESYLEQEEVVYQRLASINFQTRSFRWEVDRRDGDPRFEQAYEDAGGMDGLREILKLLRPETG